MQNNGESTELSQKYCGNLSCNVTLVHNGNDVRCLSSHLCHPGIKITCDHYIDAETDKTYRTLPTNEK